MKDLSNIMTWVVVGFLLVSCNHDDWFERQPQDILTDEQIWSDADLTLSVLANYYNRLPSLHGVFNTGGMAQLDDAMWSGHRDGDQQNNNTQFRDDYGRYWDYGFIRDINLALDKLDQFGTGLLEDQRLLFRAELRYIRSFVYFELVKRMGGVPLITEQLIYDFSGDPSSLRIPRAKEHEVYDFIFNELEEIKETLSGNNGSKTRASTFAALALQSRAMLYAGSLAKYNNLMANPIVTEGGEVGIPAAMTEEYYTKSLQASNEIINSGNYSLHQLNDDRGENFYELFMDKGSPEVIFAKDYQTGLKTHGFTFQNIARSLTEDNEGSSMLAPSLSLVESFDYLDGSEGTLAYQDINGAYIPYENPADLFANKDGRMAGTIIHAGVAFKDAQVSIQAGTYEWEEERDAYQFRIGTLGERNESGDLITGFDGPNSVDNNVSATGFYARKFVSAGKGASARGILAENWWPWFRLGEIYLNAAEAAFELGQADAVTYINTLRERAGFNPNSMTTLTLELIQKERRVELAFEDHRYFDLKRWRIAHELWDGSSDEAIVYGLYPYRIEHPGHPDHNKYIFEKTRSSRIQLPRFFRMANYYASIEQGVLDNNPKLIRNPFH